MSAAAAAAAAAAIRRARHEEEERMTGYTPADLAEGWEFKIIRASTRLFRDPQRLKEVLAEEARAGWTMVEKFDNQRIRLKRPAAAKTADAGLGFDPYRTHVGISDVKLAAIIFSCVFGGIAVIVLLILLIAKSLGTTATP